MLKKYNYEEKTLEKAIEKFKEELNITEEDCLYRDSIQKGSLLKSSKVLLTVIKKEDIKAIIREYFESLAPYIGVNIETEVQVTKENIKVKLNSNNPSILIGKNGKMLTSLQILLRRYIEQETEMSIKLYLDVENYKERKLEQLERNVKKIIKDVLRTKVDVKLDEMNSYERRIVHNIVSEYGNLESSSVGEEPHRCVVIKYIER